MSSTARMTGDGRSYDYDYDADGFSRGRDRDDERGGRSRNPQAGPGFLAAPFSGRTWRESLHLVVNLPVAVLTFSYAVIMFAAGTSLVVTFLGMPILAALIVGCRGFAAMERARARGLLRLDVPAPAPLRPARPGLMAWIGAALKSGAGWRSVLYSVLMLPFSVLSFSLTVTLWVAGIGYGSYPLWQWVFPHYVNVPGLQLYSNNGHTVYLSSVPQIAGVCAAGLLVLFITPWVVRGLANTQRAMARGLLK
ncbi:sensor domain-containing protein [Streptacidiphilus sp. N1-10]|uniref:Sensor domain-containing protein n=1 Tax=Streptacidiphilus jeojiensis TaxID=3229225 RepID=A0ABV6XIK0_9ACTN